MRHFIRITLTALAAGTAVAAVMAVAMPVWLLLRVPSALTPPEPDAG